MVTLAMVLIVVPGEESYFGAEDTWSHRQAHNVQCELAGEDLPYGIKWGHVSVYIHGYPWPCFVRGIEGHPADEIGTTTDRVFSEPLFEVEGEEDKTFGVPVYEPVTWSNFDNWPLETDTWRADYWLLYLDLMIFAVVLVTTLVATERWIRWRGGLLRIRLVELLVGITCISLLLGWYHFHSRLQEREQDTLDLMEEHRLIVHASRSYFGPVWLSRLLGNQHLTPQLLHVTHADVDLSLRSWSSDPQEASAVMDDLALTQEFVYLDSLTIWSEYFDTSKDIASRSAIPISKKADRVKVKVNDLTLCGNAFLKEEITPY
ncbi:hypothetical protein [Aeoliella mucimassa]|uniref:Uncharacterized protein n=1 Tax=Aeoliella mucimassa TaxID=2527972 RepID=A0A518AGI8_9BACT|nr:hypothetical protein [Aeoliella mucimassa]QDU53845.1 hypothetical protein Pan181_00230 [Aeoliella mucimassa]